MKAIEGKIDAISKHSFTMEEYTDEFKKFQKASEEQRKIQEKSKAAAQEVGMLENDQDGEEIEMTYYNKLTERCRVLTYKTEIIPARSEKIIPVWPGAPRITGGILVDDPVLTNSDSGWLVAHALVEVKAGVLPARIINLTGNNLVFKEGSYE